MKLRLKMSKTILLFVMLFCVMITFGFVSMNASAMQCNEDKLVELSQDEHKHNYSFKRISYKHHQLKCECGAVKGEAIPHMISSSDVGKRYAECIDCHDMLDMNTDMALVGGETSVPEEPHTHKYTYIPLGISQHKGYCTCGRTITGNHKFVQADIGKQKCLLCDYEVEFQTGILEMEKDSLS